MRERAQLIPQTTWETIGPNAVQNLRKQGAFNFFYTNLFKFTTNEMWQYDTELWNKYKYFDWSIWRSSKQHVMREVRLHSKGMVFHENDPVIRQDKSLGSFWQQTVVT